MLHNTDKVAVTLEHLHVGGDPSRVAATHFRSFTGRRRQPYSGHLFIKRRPPRLRDLSRFNGTDYSDRQVGSPEGGSDHATFRQRASLELCCDRRVARGAQAPCAYVGCSKCRRPQCWFQCHRRPRSARADVQLTLVANEPAPMTSPFRARMRPDLRATSAAHSKSRGQLDARSFGPGF